MKKSCGAAGSSRTGSRRYVLPSNTNSAAPGTGCEYVVPASVASVTDFGGLYGIHFAFTRYFESGSYQFNPWNPTSVGDFESFTRSAYLSSRRMTYMFSVPIVICG